MSTNRFRLTFHGYTIEKMDDNCVYKPFEDGPNGGYSGARRFHGLNRQQLVFLEGLLHEMNGRLLEAGSAHEDAMRHPVMEPTAKGKK